MKLEFSRYIFETQKILNFVKIHPVVAELFQADRQTNMTKLIVAFRNFADAPKNNFCLLFSRFPKLRNKEDQRGPDEVLGNIYRN
jgi:hypothetical protein